MAPLQRRRQVKEDGKRPASQYYWGDWRRDTALQSCSIAARGLWHEMNCLMHDCEPYGHLCVGLKPMQPAQLARLVGISARQCSALLAELEAGGIFSRTDDGVIYSRRMVRDEALRERRASGGAGGSEHGHKGAEHGSKGGRPKAEKGVEEPPFEPPFEPPLEPPFDGAKEPPLHPPIKPPPASASASASASAEREPPHPPAPASPSLHRFPPGFEEFWSAYPRKVGKDAAAKAFAKRRVGSELLATMLRALASQRQSEQWQRDRGQYVPHPATWLNEGRWQDEDGPSASFDAVFGGAK